MEDVLALGSFFHYAEGFTAPEGFDLTLPEFNIVGQMKVKFLLFLLSPCAYFDFLDFPTSLGYFLSSATTRLLRSSTSTKDAGRIFLANYFSALVLSAQSL